MEAWDERSDCIQIGKRKIDFPNLSEEMNSDLLSLRIVSYTE